MNFLLFVAFNTTQGALGIGEAEHLIAKYLLVNRNTKISFRIMYLLPADNGIFMMKLSREYLGGIRLKDNIKITQYH